MARNEANINNGGIIEGAYRPGGEALVRNLASKLVRVSKMPG